MDTATAGTPAELDAEPEGQRDLGGQFLTFFIDQEEYGLEILKVQEIIGSMDITPVPRTPEYILGVINLRGKVIPVLDLRLKFQMEPIERTQESCIIVVRAHGVETGVQVDRVSEVVDIPGGLIDHVPTFGTDLRSDFLLGIGKAEDRIKLLLDIDRVLTEQDAEELQTAAVQE